MSGTEEQYKHLYQKQEIDCPTCNGQGKVFRPDIEAVDRTCRDLFQADKEFRDEAASEDLGGGWFRCKTCQGRGKVFDPIETYGQELTKDQEERGERINY